MSQNEEFVLSQDEKDIIGEVSNISMGAAATALSSIIGQKVVITAPNVEKGTQAAIQEIEKIPSIGVIISYTEGVSGENFLIMREADAAKIVGAMMGEALSPDEEFGEMQISAIAEVMNQMMGSSATSLSEFIGRSVNISPPSAFLLTDENKEEKLGFLYDGADRSVLVRFRFLVGDLFESEIYMVMSHDFSQELVSAMLAKMGMKSLDEAQGEPAPAPAPVQASAQAAPAAQAAPPAVPAAAPQPAPQAQHAEDPVRREVAAARPTVLPSFDTAPVLNQQEQNNFELIQEVPLSLSVEVGRAHKLVKEVLDLSVGSIIELDKQAGDPVDVIVNGQKIAHGEVVVIDESFGVRITEIFSKSQG